jgi:hypothetical protein
VTQEINDLTGTLIAVIVVTSIERKTEAKKKAATMKQKKKVETSTTAQFAESAPAGSDKA